MPPGMGAGAPMGAGMGGAMGAPQMGQPPPGQQPMNMQPGMPQMGGGGFGSSPNTTTTSTTSPKGDTTLMGISTGSLGGTNKAKDLVLSSPTHKSSPKNGSGSLFGLDDIREEIKGWASTGSSVGKHALEKLDNVERRVRIIEKGVERTTDALARGSRDELLERVLAEVEEMKKAVTSISEVQKQQMRLLQDVVTRTRALEKNQG